ncbi:hypothetical protein M2368_003432 [Arthrobacter sp. JUb119]|nr:hypothetical protein [Arthrobacter sp. JUb119]TDU22493.1 hypothetical protein EDF61_10923 [Arthrobacter sp. JUb115]
MKKDAMRYTVYEDFDVLGAVNNQQHNGKS